MLNDLRIKLGARNGISSPKIGLRAISIPRGSQLALALLALATVSYFGYQLSFFAAKPYLFLKTPYISYIKTSEPFVDIAGTIQKGARLVINHRPVSSSNGEFSERLYLSTGVNPIEVEAINLRGKLVEKKVFVVYNP